MTASSFDGLLERVRAEYLEMPGLRLKLEQVNRLCGVERPLCQRVLHALVNQKFLCAKADGSYARLTDGVMPRPSKEKAPDAAATTGAR